MRAVFRLLHAQNIAACHSRRENHRRAQYHRRYFAAGSAGCGRTADGAGIGADHKLRGFLLRRNILRRYALIDADNLDFLVINRRPCHVLAAGVIRVIDARLNLGFGIGRICHNGEGDGNMRRVTDSRRRIGTRRIHIYQLELSAGTGNTVAILIDRRV